MFITTNWNPVKIFLYTLLGGFLFVWLSLYGFNAQAADYNLLPSFDGVGSCSWSGTPWNGNRSAYCDNYDASNSTGINFPIGLSQWDTWRSVLQFDTSSVVGTIESANLELTYNYFQSGSTAFDLYVVPSAIDGVLSWADVHSPTYTDYGHVSIASTPDNGDKITIPLSAAGIAAINQSGTTEFMVINGMDFNNVTSGYSVQNAYFSEESTNVAPRLQITLGIEEEATTTTTYDIQQPEIYANCNRVMYQVIDPTVSEISGIEMYFNTGGRPNYNIILCQGSISQATAYSKFDDCGTDTLIAKSNCTTSAGWKKCYFDSTKIIDPALNFYFIAYQTFDTTNYNYCKYSEHSEIAGALYGTQKSGASPYTYAGDLSFKTFYDTVYNETVSTSTNGLDLFFNQSIRCSPNTSCVIPYNYNQELFDENSLLWVYNVHTGQTSTSTIIDNDSALFDQKTDGRSYFVYQATASTTKVKLEIKGIKKNGDETDIYIVPVYQISSQFLDVLGDRLETQTMASSSMMYALTGTTTHALVCTPAEWNSESWVTIAKCNILKSAFDFSDFTGRIAIQVINTSSNALSNTFPFNLPIGFANSWISASGKPLPPGLSFIDDYLDSSGNLTFNIPATMAQEETKITIIGSDSFDSSPATNSFFAFIRSMSAYIMYGLFVFNMYILGTSLYSSLYHNED
jgi:hypothetical protein